MSANNVLLMNLSLSPQELVKKAVQLAKSAEPGDQSQVLGALSAEDFLARLDTRDEYIRLRAKQLHFARILKVLMNNDAAAAKQTLAALTQAPTFQASDKREELLVKALAVVRPAPTVAINYWDQRSGPDHILLHFVIDALCDNGSEPAIQLLEKKLIDPDQDVDFKITWMRDPILRHRNDLPLLQACYRLLTTTLPPDLRPFLVEALFDHRRDEWYHACLVPKPPNRALASKEARNEMRRICEYADQEIPLTPEQSAALKRVWIVELGRDYES